MPENIKSPRVGSPLGIDVREEKRKKRCNGAREMDDDGAVEGPWVKTARGQRKPERDSRTRRNHLLNRFRFECLTVGGAPSIHSAP